MEKRALGTGLTVIIWAVVGAILLLTVSMDLIKGNVPEPIFVLTLFVAVWTIVGALFGDTLRRAVGFIWLLVLALGVICFVIGAGMGLRTLVQASLGMMFGGALTAYLLFLPDHK